MATLPSKYRAVCSPRPASRGGLVPVVQILGHVAGLLALAAPVIIEMGRPDGAEINANFIRPWRRGMTAAPPLAGARCRAFIDNILVNAIFTVG